MDTLLSHTSHTADMSFALFAMLLALLGIAGDHKIHISSINLGPVSTPWRIVSFVLAIVMLGSLRYMIGTEQPPSREGREHRRHRPPVVAPVSPSN